MKAVFADAFYWAALTMIRDPAHGRALDLNRSLAPGMIGPSIRIWAGRTVAGLIDAHEVLVIA